MTQNKLFLYRTAAIALCAATVMTPLSLKAATLFHGDPNDFECLVHTAYGEANNTSEREQAVIANGIVFSARKNGRSICGEVRARYAARYASPNARNKSSPSVLRAVENVLHGGATDVPAPFRQAVEFRSAASPTLYVRGLVLVGQITPGRTPGHGGNRFYRWNYAIQPHPYGILAGHKGPR